MEMPDSTPGEQRIVPDNCSPPAELPCESPQPFHTSRLPLAENCEDSPAAQPVIDEHHPLFSARYYCKQRPDIEAAGADPFTHYIQQGYTEGVNPHPLFDERYYQQQSGNSTSAGLVHYLTKGFEHFSPHPLFDRLYYLQQKAERAVLRKSERLRISLGRTALFSEAEEEEREVAIPLLDYVLNGIRSQLNPHPLFHTAYYYQQRPDVLASGVNALSHFIEYGHSENVSPCPLFQTSYYRQAVQNRLLAGNPLVDYLTRGRSAPSPHPLFENAWYAASLERAGRTLPATMSPLLHFAVDGAAAGHTPCAMFDPAFYTANYPEAAAAGGDPFSHFLTTGWQQGCHPHPLFDVSYYLRRHPELKAAGINPLQHYMECSRQEAGETPCWAFYPAEYLRFRQSRELSLPHAADHFFREYYSPESVGYHSSDETFQALYTQLNLRRPLLRGVHPTRFLIALPDARCSEENRFAHRWIQTLHTQFGIHCILFLFEGGDYEADFDSVATVIRADQLQERFGTTNLSLLLLAAHRPGWTLSLCLSLECADFARLCSSLNIPLVSYLYQMPRDADFSSRLMQCLIHTSRIVMYASDAVSASVHCRLLPQEVAQAAPAVTVSPGISPYVPEPGGREACRYKVCSRLGLDPDSFLVLGCGSLDSHDGAEIFIAVASAFFAAHPERPCTFLWLAEPTKESRSIESSLIADLRQANLEDRILFLKEEQDFATYIGAADTFANFSRFSVFPPSILEAMAAGVPVVAFGADQGLWRVLGTDGGFALSHLNISGAAEKLLQLSSNPELCRSMGEAAASRAAHIFDVSQSVQQAIEAVSSVMEWDVIGTYCRPHRRNGASQRLPVYFLTPDWVISGVNTFIDRIVEGLRKNAWDARILFTGPRPFFGGIKPRSPWLTLPVQGPAVEEERWENVRAFLGSQGPVLAVLGYDHLSNAVSPALPDWVGLLGMLQSDEANYYETAYRLGRYWNRLIAVSQHIADTVEELNPALSARTCVIPNAALRADEIQHLRRPEHHGTSIRLVYTGRFVHNQKRFLDFVPLVETLDRTGIDYQFTFAGQ
jgi:glycosyltransferase involved in cell wall biosynthesis